MSKFYYSVSLPVKPYVLKYVQTVEGSPTVEFRGASMLCQIIRAFMLNKNYSGRSRPELETFISNRTAKLQIQVPIKSRYKVGLEISPHGILFINRFLEDWFNRALVKFMNENTRKDGRYKGFKEAYYAFAELYNLDLEEDITLDGLKQMDFRLRKKREDDNNKSDENFFSHLVPSL